MKTLYDLLGALPDDDAEELRSAFRKAVKSSHPDINPGDTDAALRFRQIVRAHEILGDRDQRAAYDHLLELARDEQAEESKRAVAAKVHKVASGVMAFAGASAAAVGGYLVFMHVSAASIAQLKPYILASDPITVSPVQAKVIEVSAVSTDSTAPASDTASTDTAVETVASLPEKPAQPESSDQADMTTNASAAVTAAASEKSASSPCGVSGCSAEAAVLANAASPAATNDAKFYRDRGMASYRKGDMIAAVADLDQAIQLDPKFSAAYVDRGTVFYRMRKFDRAFSDVASAKRIDRSNRAVMDAMARKQPLRPLRLDPPKLTRVSQRRTAVAE